jgi:hypothetical protein
MSASNGLYAKVEQFVVHSLIRAGRLEDIRHARRTVYWLENLAPSSDDLLRIAAVAHDIERAFREPHMEHIIGNSPEGFKDPSFLKAHSEKGARIVGDFLRTENASPEDIERVEQLVAGHEFEGTEAQNLLKDADSLSNFETIAHLFVEQRADTLGKEKVRAKFDWMYNRISSERAREIAYPMYREAIRALEDKFG